MAKTSECELQAGLTRFDVATEMSSLALGLARKGSRNELRY